MASDCACPLSEGRDSTGEQGCSPALVRVVPALWGRLRNKRCLPAWPSPPTGLDGASVHLPYRAPVHYSSVVLSCSVSWSSFDVVAGGGERGVSVRRHPDRKPLRIRGRNQEKGQFYISMPQLE